MIDDGTRGKISVWVGTTSKSFDEFNAYFEGLEDPESNCGIHRDFGCTFIDTDMFGTYGTADNVVVPIEELCKEVGCRSLETERAIVAKCRSMGIVSGNSLSYYGNATFIETEPGRTYNDMRFIGTFDDP
ncbi:MULTISPECIES: immunity 22 family protein [unclassified Pseudomonas]|uniref:immunity 22 family protein n=1 Tax=unclassified Pseudomonas TaxID=196821 RepID=UPI00244C24E8|nr:MULTISPECIES: immunity 22 family protein [unclassified Pseudomonas]MDG9926816.1 immunity 22 family protein [Pseudomonas sp. GD04042]MDH0484378.1 immunity 22 family protein [Pseudomonas sp. GD04015]MDH0606598.1 immunity 22 family protein [Pseudomonas sp. GD03869]